MRRRSPTYGHCGRTSRRVRLGRLVEDGEMPGLLVERREADPEHPQKRPKPIGPEYVIRHPAPPYASFGTTVRVGTLGNPATGDTLTGLSVAFALGSFSITTE